MFAIDRIRIEHMSSSEQSPVITDNPHPRFSFSLKSDRRETSLRSACIRVNGWEKEITDPLNIVYEGPALKPLTVYRAELLAKSDAGETARAEAFFQTGRLMLPWRGKWISDPDFHVESPASPVPMTFRRRFVLQEAAENLQILMTAMGVFDLYLDGRRLNDDYFAPGFTNYEADLQYVLYTVPGLTAGEHEFRAVVAHRHPHQQAVVSLRDEELLRDGKAVLLSFNDRVAQAVAAAIGVKLRLHRLPAGVPDDAAVADIQMKALLIQRRVIVAVTGQTAKPGVTEEGVAAGRVGAEREEVLAAQIVDPGQGSPWGCDDVFFTCVVKETVFHDKPSFVRNRLSDNTIE